MHSRFKFIIAFFTLCIMAAAQSTMSDEQVMEFIIEEHSIGTQQKDIVVKLMEKGVTIEQIQRIRKQYEDQSRKNDFGIETSINTIQNDRTRKNDQINKNNQVSKNNDKAKTQSPKKSDSPIVEASQEPLAKIDDEQLFYDELNFLLPKEEIVEEVPNRENEVFGRNVFNQQHLTFEPNPNIATPTDYILGAGDEVYIDVWGASQKTISGIISPDGNLDIADYGPLHLSGLTIDQANKRLRNTLGTRYANSEMKLSLGQTRTINVNVMGEVSMPGTYTMSAFATVFHALYAAGGINEIGTLRNIEVWRNGKRMTSVDIYDYMLNGKLTGNIRLQEDDVIIVGTYDCLVKITGKVKRPMFYEMKNTENVATLIKYAGGFTGDAFTEYVRLIRKSEGQKSVYNINEIERTNFHLCDGDSLAVDSSLNRFKNMAVIKGAVFRPGIYQMNGDVSTVRSLVETAGGLLEEAFTTRAVMHRMRSDRSLEMISVDLIGIMENRVADIPLRNEDVLYIPSLKDLQDELTFSISGEVLYPGKYRYATNTTIEDLILQAGGLRDAASLVKVDVSRRIRDKRAIKASEDIAQTFSFSIKDGFVVDGEAGFILEPFDEVIVRRSPGYIEQEHVYVGGEVTFAGDYTITQKGQRLSDLIKNAGGLTDKAYIEGARLERKLTEDEKLKRKRMLQLISNVDSLNYDKIESGNTRFIGIQLDKALANPGSQWDIVVEEGDRLFVPQYNNTITINGEVMYPNTVSYQKGKKLSHYIDQAGGFSNKAKKRSAFAVNMNGTVTKLKKRTEIQPGCEILIPAKRERRGMKFSEILGLGTMTATLGTVIATLVK